MAQVPFIFKDIVDTLSITATSPETVAAALPLSMLVGCEGLRIVLCCARMCACVAVVIV